ncbi:MAG TPA: alpha/beta fold hydrolase [Nevskia sp.]|nr:alpha/beta fold hydrolase [Nevskia sp.]
MKLLKRVVLVLAACAAAFFTFDFFFPAQFAAAALGAERGAAGLQRKAIDIPGFSVVYLEGGQGKPLLLVHGFNGDKDNWTRVSKYLTPRYRVIAVDLPCWGESPRPTAEECDIPHQLVYLNEIADALKLEHFDLGGNSMGGWIAAAYAAAHPERVDTLWLLAPAGVAGAELSDLGGIVRSGGRIPLIARNEEEMQELLSFVCVHPPYVPHAVLQVMAQRQADHYELEQQIFAGLVKEPPLEPQLQGLQTPAFIVWGDHDRALHYSGAAILHRLMPNSQVLIMPDIGHVPMLETPSRSAADYIAFRDSLVRR